MTIPAALDDGVDMVVGKPDDAVHGERVDVDAEDGRVPVLVLPIKKTTIHTRMGKPVPGEF
jgi:hypothetical protein